MVVVGALDRMMTTCCPELSTPGQMQDVHVSGKNHTKTCECVRERNTVTMDECF